MVIDDDPDSREVVAELLMEHFSVVTAGDGPEGLELFRRQQPQAVVTDQSLPGMDGTQLARRLKALAPEVPVVLLTGHSEVEGAEACDAVMQKPFEPERLIELLSRLSAKVLRCAHPGGADEVLHSL